jgi:hypothetical protein
MKTNPTFGSRVSHFYAALTPPQLPKGVGVMNPYTDPQVRKYVGAFLNQYFNDNDPRLLIFGINPGRFGAGVTGVTFTDPVALADYCSIGNHLPRRRELSSIFIYDLIQSMGGPSKFYRNYFLSAICPLGFTRDGKNMNYYDDPRLATAVTPFILESIRSHIRFGGRTDRAVVLGNGQNFRFMQTLNEEHNFFGRIDALEHPRFIMQYRRRRIEEFLKKYRTCLESTQVD